MPHEPRRRGPRDAGPWAGFGAGVARRRRELGLTQRDLADLADVAVATVQGLEAGRLATRLGSLAAILDALGLTLTAVPSDRAAQIGADDANAIRLTPPGSTPGEVG
ncbi:MAG TPA: helix-turn-helix domain-containing protein [Actinomycetes bacterium]|nr:helix-turn-helix domain-containing protein [Actinomycetes bacterium]